MTAGGRPAADRPEAEAEQATARVVAVAGATGFIGRALVSRLLGRHEVIALSRRALDTAPQPGLEARRCDLFSLSQVEAALAGAGSAVYLVHSMLPSARLVQGRFEDLDLLLADNFGRAAARAGVRRIVYLGGLIPDSDDLSPHLRSRREVEAALGGYGVPVTSVRAGLVIGPGGSSFEILLRLVQRLPAMVCPRWTGSRTQPIALEDVLAILERCIDDDATRGRVCEVGGPTVLTYRELMGETARLLGKRRLMLSVPLLTPKLSRLWVTLVTRKPRALVEPLVESLRHEMVAHDLWLQRRMERPGLPLAAALAAALAAEAAPSAQEPGLRPARTGPREVPRTAQSIQRLPIPGGWPAPRVANEYLAWLPRLLRRLLRVERDGPTARFFLLGGRRPALELTFLPERSDPTRAVFAVSGGWLVRDDGEPPGRLEFLLAPDGGHVIAGVQEFRPRLPWFVYAWSQARVHLWVMERFGRHLRALRDAPS